MLNPTRPKPSLVLTPLPAPPGAPQTGGATQPARPRSDGFSRVPGPASDWSTFVGSSAPLSGDAALAEATLRPLFKIVPDKVCGAAPNAVTRAELREVAQLYSDIRSGKTSIAIDDGKPGGAAFKDAVMADVAKILQTSEGRKLIKDLARSPHKTEILDLFAGKTPATPDDAAKQAAFRTQTQPLPNASLPVGMDSQIKYAAGVVADPYPGEVVHEWESTPSDVMLFHELVHARRHGTDQVATGYGIDGDGRGSKGSELQATGVGDFASPGDGIPTENDYRSARRALGDDVKYRSQYSPAK